MSAFEMSGAWVDSSHFSIDQMLVFHSVLASHWMDSHSVAVAVAVATTVQGSARQRMRSLSDRVMAFVSDSALSFTSSATPQGQLYFHGSNLVLQGARTQQDLLIVDQLCRMLESWPKVIEVTTMVRKLKHAHEQVLEWQMLTAILRLITAQRPSLGSCSERSYSQRITESCSSKLGKFLLSFLQYLIRYPTNFVLLVDSPAF